MEDKGRGTDDKDTTAQGRFGSIPLGRRAFVKGVLLTGALAVPAVRTLAYAEEDPTIADDTTDTTTVTTTAVPTHSGSSKPTKPTTPSGTTTEPTPSGTTLEPTPSGTTTEPTPSGTTLEPTPSGTTTTAPTTSGTTTEPASSTATTKPSATALPRTGDDATHAAIAGAGLAGLTLAALGAVLDAHGDDED